MNLMIISMDNYSHLVTISNNELLEEIKSDKVIWSSNEKYLFYLESLSFCSYKIKNKRKKKSKL